MIPGANVYLLRVMPNLNISVEDTVLGAGVGEGPPLDLALLGEEVMSGLSCPEPFAGVRVHGVLISFRSQRCAPSSVGLRRLMRGISML
jgi:hypothetical protein